MAVVNILLPGWPALACTALPLWGCCTIVCIGKVLGLCCLWADVSGPITSSAVPVINWFVIDCRCC